MLSGLGLLLAAIGLYSVMKLTRWFSGRGDWDSRDAGGAQPQDIMRLVVRQGIRVRGGGLDCGLTGGFGVGACGGGDVGGSGPC